jgi:hypothetical protein
VNRFYSERELEYYPRWLTPDLQAAVEQHPIVVLTGARQVGKSTLLRHAEPFASWQYYTLDDFDVLLQAERDPRALWAGASAIVLDEVQKVPTLLPAVKHAADQAKGNLRFVLSGSANLLLMQHVSESLAGRAIYFALHPMAWGETLRKPAPTLVHDLLAGQLPADKRINQVVPDLIPLLLRGWLPALLRFKTSQAVLQWWEGYLTTYLERDLRQLSQIDSLSDFRRMMQFLALRTGQLLNQSEVARDAGLSQPTTHRYINLLEATYLLQRLPAFTASRTTRLLKSPKVHWADSGLAIYLAGYFDVAALQHARELGSLFETFVVQQLRVLAELETPHAQLSFWRTVSGKEVDVVIEQGRRMIACEIKMSETVTFADAEGIRLFLAEHPKNAVGIVIYCGKQIKHLDEKIVAVPLNLILGA